MSGRCIYCGFYGTDEMLMDHAGKCSALEDGPPDLVDGMIRVKTPELRPSKSASGAKKERK